MAIETKQLESMAYLSGLSVAELEKVSQHVFEKAVGRNELIVMEGEPAEAVYFVVSGAVKVFKTSAEGKEQILCILRHGDSFNDVPVFDGGPNPASAVAMTPVNLRGINKAAMPVILREHPNVATNVIRVLAEKVRHTALRYVNSRGFMFVGRGVTFPAALEGALKLKEVSYTHAEGYAAGEMKHGPISLLDAECPLVAVATQSTVYEKLVSNVMEGRARDARVIAVATEGDEAIDAYADDIFRVPATLEALSPILAVIPLQLFAYHMAVARGTDVDQPRNLAKSVTVE